MKKYIIVISVIAAIALLGIGVVMATNTYTDNKYHSNGKTYGGAFALRTDVEEKTDIDCDANWFEPNPTYAIELLHCNDEVVLGIYHDRYQAKISIQGNHMFVITGMGKDQYGVVVNNWGINVGDNSNYANILADALSGELIVTKA